MMCLHPTLFEVLVAQDFKYHKLLQQIEALGFERLEKHPSHLGSLICNLMHVPEAHRDTWMELYASYLTQAKDTHNPSVLAKRCFQELSSLPPNNTFRRTPLASLIG